MSDSNAPPKKKCTCKHHHHHCVYRSPRGARCRNFGSQRQLLGPDASSADSRFPCAARALAAPGLCRRVCRTGLRCVARALAALDSAAGRLLFRSLLLLARAPALAALMPLRMAGHAAANAVLRIVALPPTSRTKIRATARWHSSGTRQRSARTATQLSACSSCSASTSATSSCAADDSSALAAPPLRLDKAAAGEPARGGPREEEDDERLMRRRHGMG